MILDLDYTILEHLKMEESKSTTFPHSNIQKYTWPYPYGNTHNRIGHILIDRRRHSSIFDVRSFSAEDCDTDHYLVVTIVRERLAVIKAKGHTDFIRKGSIQEIKGVASKKKYYVEISNRFSASEG
jgi:hypothetical protein